MRTRSQKLLTSTWNVLRVFGELEVRAARAVFGPNGIGLDEALLVAGLLLIARGFWLAWPPAAYLVPGFVIVWIALPSRAVFVARHPVEPEKPARRKA